MMTIPQSTINNLVLNLLQNGGVATLKLPQSIAETNKQAFQKVTLALDVAVPIAGDDADEYVHDDDDVDVNVGSSNHDIPIISPNSNSASVTGYHSAGSLNSLSRYNTYREGFIFSNGESFDIKLLTDDDTDTDLTFQQATDGMFHNMCQIIAKSTLRGIARYLNLDNEDWFEFTYGPMETSSQWHIKRYVEPLLEKKMEAIDIDDDDSKLNQALDDKQHLVDCEGGPQHEDEIEWLPTHTDPSLISVIIHDAPGTNQNAMGLQYQYTLPIEEDSNLTKNQKKKRVWREVESHGHQIATIFCGSLMSYITGGLFQSAKHRVIYNPQEQTLAKNKCRRVATLFLRPIPDSIVTVPLCDVLMERSVKIRRNLKFKDWLNRVSRNYQKVQKEQSKNKGQKNNKRLSNTNNSSNNINNDAEKLATDPTYWADELTELTLHEANPSLAGKEKYLGGELVKMNGHIYTIPGFADRVVDIDATQDPPSIKLIGPEMKGEFKWLRGIPIGDKVYGIPCHADSLLIIHALTNEVEQIKWDESSPGAAPHDQKWKYHGAAVSDYDGCIYCVPQAAEHVLKINPKTNEMTFIGPAFKGVNKWYGGILAGDGAIYGVNQNATGILRIDPKTQQCTIHGDFPEGNYKWHGGVLHTNGNLYCIPAHIDTVLKVVPGVVPRLSLIGKNIRTGEHRNDGKYKFLGGAVGGDCVYFFPSDADYVLEINAMTDQVREVGPNLRDLEPMRNNKWQNGFTAMNGIIYGIPLKGQTVLRIIPKTDGSEPDITTIGGPYRGLNKWEGGVTALNGDMYCVPLNHKCSLRIRSLKS